MNNWASGPTRSQLDVLGSGHVQAQDNAQAQSGPVFGCWAGLPSVLFAGRGWECCLVLLKWRLLVVCPLLGFIQ